MPKAQANKISPKVKQVILRLSASIRGQIFLCNLDAAIDEGLIAPLAVANALAKVKVRDIKLMHDMDLLGHLKGILQDPTIGMMLKHPRNSIYDEFLDGEHLVTVIRKVDFENYYSDPADLINGHAFDKIPAGAWTRLYRNSATTNNIFWAAPVSKFDPDVLVRHAELARDELGLVHHKKEVELVSLHFKPSIANCYRPTIIEALPNSRFRQLNPNEPNETRWGFTVDLALLDAPPPTGNISGKPELVFSKVLLKDCNVFAFCYLGETKNDRDTAEMDERFLNSHLYSSTNITQVFSRLETRLIS